MLQTKTSVYLFTFLLGELITLIDLQRVWKLKLEIDYSRLVIQLPIFSL